MSTFRKVLRIAGIVLGCLAFAVVAIGLIYPAILSLGVSLMDYKPFRGFFGSSFVGLKHFLNFFEYKYFGRILGNSALIEIIALLIGVVYTFIATYASSSIKNVFGKGFVALLFALPVAIPAIGYAYAGNIIVTNAMTAEWFVFLEEIFNIDTFAIVKLVARLCIGISYAVPLAALVSVGGLFTKGSPIKSALKLTLVYFALQMFFAFTGNFNSAFLIQNPVNLEGTEIFSTYLYKKGITSIGGYSYAAAVGVFAGLVKLIPVLLGVFGIGFITFKKDEPLTAREKGFSWSSLLSVFAVVPVVFIVGIVLIYLSNVYFWNGGEFGKVFGDSAVINSITNTNLIALFYLLFGGTMAFFVAYAVSKLRMYGAVAVALLCSIVSNLIGQFLMGNFLGLYNSYFGVVIMLIIQITPLLGLLFGIFMKHRDTIGAKIAAFFIMNGLGYCFVWSSFSTPLLFLQDSSKYPLSIISRQIIMQSVNESVGTIGESAIGFMYSHESLKFALITPYICVPMVVLGAFFTLGIVSMFISEMIEFKKAKNQ